MQRVKALSFLLGIAALGCKDQGEPVPTAPSVPVEEVTETASDTEELPLPDEEVLPTLEGDFRVIPFELEPFAYDVVAFDGKAVLLAGRKGDAVLVMRLDATRGQELERLTLPRDKLSELRVVRLGQKLTLMWVADGFLEALSLDPERPLAGQSPQRLASEEGGTLKGAPAVAAQTPTHSLVCVGDSGGLLCLTLEEGLAVSGLYKLPRSESQEAMGLSALPEGYLLLSAACRNETCSRQRYESRLLSLNGEQQGRERALPELASRDNLITIPSSEGFVLVGRRSSAGEHSAWRITEKRTDELSGTFSRVMGGFEMKGEPILVERSHLRMRKGFPVTGYVLRHLPEVGRNQRRAKVEREAFPDAISALIPREVEQRVLSHDGHLLFSTMPRKGRVKGSIVWLSPEGN